MFLEIKAVDTLFFRDGKPFSMGAENIASGIFPPFPSTVYGALRTAYYSYDNTDMDLVDTDNDPAKNLQLKGMYFLLDETPYLCIPNDLVRIKKDKENLAYLLSFQNEKEIISNDKTSYSLSLKKRGIVENIEVGILDGFEFNDYLNYQKSDYFYSSLNDWIKYEYKIGIGRDNYSKTSSEGQFYRIAMIRPKKELSILVELEGLELPQVGVLKLGAEGKMASFTTKESFPLQLSPPDHNKKFKVYLSTPAIFEKGWIPSWINEETLVGEKDGMKLKLLACANGKYVSIGGFDVKRGKPKQMRRAVPAGSVYYFELIEGDISQINKSFYGSSISEYGTDKEGFGITYTGRVE